MNRYEPRWQYNNKIVESLMRIHSAREIVMLLELPIDIEDRLKKESVLKTVHYSTKIEGNNLSFDEVYEAIENKRNIDKKGLEEVKNYYDALVFLEKKADKSVRITLDFINELHSIIDWKHIGRKPQKSSFRDGQNVVRDSVTGGISYLPPEAKDVVDLMKSLVEWIENKENEKLPIPVIAAIAAYQLVTIHPYWDGNGRTARALATYILKKNMYDLKGFYSMEEFYDKDIERYYNSLQMNMHHNYYFGRNNADLTTWITYFLDIMVEVFENISSKVSKLYKEKHLEYNNLHGIDKRTRIIINHIIKNKSVKSKDLVSYFKIDSKTARNWLENWINEGLLEKKNLKQQRNIEYILTEKSLREFNGNLTGI